MFGRINLNPIFKKAQKDDRFEETKTVIQNHHDSKTPPPHLLTTELPHPDTTHLAKLAQSNLEEGYRVLQQVDHKAIEKLKLSEEKVTQLSQIFFETLKNGFQIRMAGCGASARAATMAEKLFRQAFPNYANQVAAVNAGGDLAIIRSVEGFEDSPEYGEEQLKQSGWKSGDTYVGVSASGAPGFITGQIKHVLTTEHSQKPILLICNPLSECLSQFSQDPKTVFNNPEILNNIDILDISVDPMALAGSTRMQAATVQLNVLSFALLQAGQKLTGKPALSFEDFITTLQKSVSRLPSSQLSQLTRFEVDAYSAGNYVVYHAPAADALVVATDTTERSPTFNWPYFENDTDEFKSEKSYSSCRVVVSDSKDTESAMQDMLGREIRVLNWIKRSDRKDEAKTTKSHLLGYDLTEEIVKKRQQYMPSAKPVNINIQTHEKSIRIQFAKHEIIIPLQQNKIPQVLHDLHKQTLLKLILNSHSTLIAGRMGCFTGNLMTSVRASNVKLVNRSIALTSRLFSEADFSQRRLPPAIKDRISQEEIAEMLYNMMFVYQHGDSLVFNTKEAILTKYEKLCYLWLFHHTQLPSENLLKRLSKPESVPFVTNTQIENILAETKQDVICFEGGATYFRFSVLSADKQLYTLENSDTTSGATIKVPGGNCNVIGWNDFFALVNNALEKIKINKDTLQTFIQCNQPIIVIGMAGMGAEVNRQKLQTHLVEKTTSDPKDILVATDADTYLSALTSHGAVLIAGTGSICLGLTDKGERIQTGGLGAQLSGDPGSAYSVGRRTVLDCLSLRNNGRIWDESANIFIGSDDPLYEPIMHKLEETFKIPRSQLVGYLNPQHGERIKMAELAPIVFKYAFESKVASPLATKILKETVKELASQLGGTIDAIVKKNPALQRLPFPVILVGGIFDGLHQDKLLQLIEKEVAKMCPNIYIRWEHEPAENYVCRVVQSLSQPSPGIRMSLGSH